MILDRTQKPTTDSKINFTLPKTEIFTLSNGLRVYFINKNNLPMIRINLMINAGSKFDPKGKYGLSYLTSLVLDEGADGMDALELSDAFDMLGTSFGVSTDNDSTNLSLQTLLENFDKSLELFSKVLLKPAFNQNDFDREKTKLIIRILQSKDEPEYLADQVFDNIILGNQNSYSFPVSGYEDSVNTITLDEIKNHYTNFFIPSNAALVVVGNLNKTELLESLNKYLNNRASKSNNLTFNNFPNTHQNKIYILHKEDSVQTEIRVGHISPNRDQANYFKRMLLNTILGGQFTSRINLNLRERNGFTYGATSRFQYYKDSAFFEVSTSVGSENTGNALKEILFELNNIQNGILDSELEFAKSSITKKFPLNFETYRQIASGVSAKILFDLPDNYFDNYISNVIAVSKSEVEIAARDFINYDKLTIVLVGDKKIIADKIKNIGIEIVEVDFKGNLL